MLIGLAQILDWALATQFGLGSGAGIIGLADQPYLLIGLATGMGFPGLLGLLVGIGRHLYKSLLVELTIERKGQLLHCNIGNGKDLILHCIVYRV